MDENRVQITVKEPKFKRGVLLATPAALSALERNGSEGFEYINRHLSGDWGDVCREDRAANDEALQTGARLLSAYKLADGTRIWLITDATVDEHGTRPSTTLLLPSDY